MLKREQVLERRRFNHLPSSISITDILPDAHQSTEKESVGVDRPGERGSGNGSLLLVDRTHFAEERRKGRNFWGFERGMLGGDVESGLQKEVLLDTYDRTAKAGGFRTTSRTSMNPVRCRL